LDFDYFVDKVAALTVLSYKRHLIKLKTKKRFVIIFIDFKEDSFENQR
jgi:hypothetical protein